jgi:hypothetical protein
VPELPDDVLHGAGWLDHGFGHGWIMAARSARTRMLTSEGAGNPF